MINIYPQQKSYPLSMFLVVGTFLVSCAGRQLDTALDLKPISRLNTPWWSARHETKLQELRQNEVDIVFIGDSITHDYELSSTAPQYDFLSVWKKFYGDRHAINLGFNGDSTLNVLWRLENGELASIKPKVVVILIGTNDTIQGRTVEQTLAGINAIVDKIHQHSAGSKVLLLGILPSEGNQEKLAKDKTINQSLAEYYNESDFVTFQDVGHVFMKGETLDKSLFMDPRNKHPSPALHPDALAQAKIAEAIEPTILRLLNK